MLVSSPSVFSDTTSLTGSQIYADLSSSFISDSRASSSLDTASSVFSESVDTASTVFSDSGSEFMVDGVSEYHFSRDSIPYSILPPTGATGTTHHHPSATGSGATAGNGNSKQYNELTQRRQYYLAHAATSPKPYLHDSFNIPPCMTHSVDYVNDTAKVASEGPTSPNAIYCSQTSLPSDRTVVEQRKLRHSVSTNSPSDTTASNIKKDSTQTSSNTLPRRGKSTSKTCVFESHGKLGDTNAHSLDLLDEALSKCNVEEFNNSHVITTSTRDLGAVPSIQSSTCSVGSLHNSSTQTLHNNTSPRGGASPVHHHLCDSNNSIIPNENNTVTMPSTSQPYLEEYIDPVCHNCTKHSNMGGASSSSISSIQLQLGSKSPSSSRGPHSQQHATNNLQSQYSVSLCQVSPQHSGSAGASGGGVPAEFTHSRTEVNGIGGLASASSDASFLNPNLPLQYVDLGRFDGRPGDDWTHSTSQPKASSIEGYPQRSTGMEVYLEPRSSSMEGYDRPRYNTNNPVNGGGITTLPPSGRNGHSALPLGADLSLSGAGRSGTRSGGHSPSQFSQEYRQELILDQARQQAERDLQHSYVNMGAVLPQNMSSKVRNHYVNVSIHHQNLNHYVNMAQEFKDSQSRDSASAASATANGANKDWRKYMLAYHNSLKRPRSADSRTRGQSSSGSSARDSAAQMSRSRGKSLDNIFSGSEFDVVMPIHLNDRNNGNGVVGNLTVQKDTPKSSPRPGPKSPRRSMSVDSGHSSPETSTKLSSRPALPPRSKKPPLSLPISTTQNSPSTQSQAGMSSAAPKKTTLRRPQTAPSLGRLVTSPSGSRASSGAHTPVSPVHSARSPPGQTGASNSDYMMMQGFPREDSHSPIFCAVELPRRNDSFSSFGSRSRNCSFSSAASAEDQVNYLDMSLGRRSNRGSPSKDPSNIRNKARLARESLTSRPPRPKLMQSRSLDNELEENYLRMDVGSGSRTPNEDYICMSPSGDEDRDEVQLVASSGDELENDNRSTTSSGGATEKPRAPPFENLITHQPYTDRQKVFVPKSKSVDSGSSTPPLPEQPAQSNKQRFLSRLIRRNSSKSDRKSSKSSTAEECVSPPNEPAIPEGTATDVQSSGQAAASFGLAPPQTQQFRKGSFDDRQSSGHTYEYPNVPAPTKGRSMSYTTGMPPPPGLFQGLPHQGSNLTDEEKQLSLTSPKHSSSGGSPDSQHGSSPFAPALPTKSTEAFNPPKMTDSPAYMLVVPGQIPTTMTNSEHKFMSKSDIVGYHVEHDYCEPDLPPTLPRKTGKRRKSRDVILTSPTSFLSGSSRSSSNDRNLSSPASADLLYATDDGKASSTSSSAATSPRSMPRNQDNWLLVDIPPSQQPDHPHGNRSEDVWVQRSPMSPQGEYEIQFCKLQA